MRREHDPQKKRWNLKLEVQDADDLEQCLTMGIMTESMGSGALKLQTMVDKKVKCIAKNYSVDEETKAGITMTDKQGTLSFDAPNDPLDPVFIHKSG